MLNLSWEQGGADETKATRSLSDNKDTSSFYQKGSGCVYFLTYEDKQDPNCDLQTEGDAK